MHWVLQTETATDGTRVSDTTSGHVQIADGDRGLVAHAAMLPAAGTPAIQAE